MEFIDVKVFPIFDPVLVGRPSFPVNKKMLAIHNDYGVGVIYVQPGCKDFTYKTLGDCLGEAVFTDIKGVTHWCPLPECQYWLQCVYDKFE